MMCEDKLLCVGFITYNPDESLIRRIELLLNNNFTVFLFDNTPSHMNICQSFSTFTNFNYITGGKNLGLGLGLSILNATAFKKNFKSLLFFDQDTIFNLECINFIDQFYKDKSNSLIDYSSVVFNAKKRNIERMYFNEVMFSISSGSLFFLENMNKINYHDTSFFVDCVDYEYCLNSLNRKFKIGEFSNTPGFDHVTGQEDKEYLFLGKKLFLRPYPLKRIQGTLSASLKLAIRSFLQFNFKYTYGIVRSLMIYVWFQILVRIIKIYKNNGK